MSKASGPAFPSEEIDSGGCTPQRGLMRGGLTKREYFAGLAMQGMVALGPIEGQLPGIARCVERCVRLADALLAELSKDSPSWDVTE